MAIAADTSRVTHLIERLADGDDRAREELIRFAESRLRNLASRMLRGNCLRRWERTDDVLQQTLLRLTRRLSDLRATNTAMFLAFAAQNMRHALIDLARHYYGPTGWGANYLSDAQAVDGRSSDAEALDRQPGPEGLLDQAERWSRLYGAIDELPDEERQVVDLVWLHDLPQAEVAVLLGVAEKTVGRRWRRARLRLHDALAGEMPLL
jgi:RNA polymerase sigma-70 factor (ECF subfamily)